MKFRVIQKDIVRDELIDIPDLGEIDDEQVKDSIAASWNQLFNELVDEGENRIDRHLQPKANEPVDNLVQQANPVIHNYIDNIQQSLTKTLTNTYKYLVNYIKKNYK